MNQDFLIEAKQVRDELSKTVANMIPLGGPDWQEWNKARRIKIRTDIESLLIMYDQCIARLENNNENDRTKELLQNVNPLKFDENE